MLPLLSGMLVCIAPLKLFCVEPTPDLNFFGCICPHRPALFARPCLTHYRTLTHRPLLYYPSISHPPLDLCLTSASPPSLTPTLDTHTVPYRRPSILSLSLLVNAPEFDHLHFLLRHWRSSECGRDRGQRPVIGIHDLCTSRLCRIRPPCSVPKSNHGNPPCMRRHSRGGHRCYGSHRRRGGRRSYRCLGGSGRGVGLALPHRRGSHSFCARFQHGERIAHHDLIIGAGELFCEHAGRCRSHIYCHLEEAGSERKRAEWHGKAEERYGERERSVRESKREREREREREMGRVGSKARRTGISGIGRVREKRESADRRGKGSIAGWLLT